MKNTVGLVIGGIFGAVASIIISLIVNLFGAVVGYANFKVFSAVLPAAILFAILGFIFTNRPISNKSLWIISIISAWICPIIINTIGTSVQAYLEYGVWLKNYGNLTSYAILIATIMLPVTIPLTRLAIYWFQLLFRKYSYLNAK